MFENCAIALYNGSLLRPALVRELYTPAEAPGGFEIGRAAYLILLCNFDTGDMEKIGDVVPEALFR
ncbi:hypothetical protein WJU16_08100 [Chitinophaga pollutisoli]|uniref:Uncharacterized protein n=1 Tax=Chitinophaga pollutisoli TaxID=3133966 RepID=A0ABZ2YUP9_9BACT